MMTAIESVAGGEGNATETGRWCWGENPELCLYRRRTIGMLRRYMHLSTESGKLPSVLGSEFFRTRVTSYTIYTFEDVVIFVHDVESCLAKLDEFSRKVIARRILQEYTQDETVALLGSSRRTIGRTLAEGLDHLSEIFLANGIMRHFGEVPPEKQEKTCQEGEMDENFVTM